MADILFIKTSSLGDVVHHMPALTEARAHRPDARFAWVVEEAFAPLVRLHPAVREVIPVSLRRWRGSLSAPATWAEMLRFRQALRSRRFDAVIDTQGLVKSALVTRSARGQRHGYDAHSIKERFASHFYDVRHPVEWKQHAVARNRALTAAALGYTPEGPPDYGLDRARIAQTTAAPYAVLLHATARPGKQWPEDNWRALATALSPNIDLVLPWGSDAEHESSVRIASGVARTRVPEKRPLDDVARLIAGASFVVGVDTGLLHLAAALGVPLVAIFAGSEPELTGPMGRGPLAVVGTQGSPPSVETVMEAVERIRPR